MRDVHILSAFEQATSAPRALLPCLDELRRLHRKSWPRRSRPPARRPALVHGRTCGSSAIAVRESPPFFAAAAEACASSSSITRAARRPRGTAAGFAGPLAECSKDALPMSCWLWRCPDRFRAEEPPAELVSCAFRDEHPEARPRSTFPGHRERWWAFAAPGSMPTFADAILPCDPANADPAMPIPSRAGKMPEA